MKVSTSVHVLDYDHIGILSSFSGIHFEIFNLTRIFCVDTAIAIPVRLSNCNGRLFDDFREVKIHIVVLSVVTSCILVYGHQRVGGKSSGHKKKYLYFTNLGSLRF
jgi:hypothetical protein